MFNIFFDHLLNRKKAPALRDSRPLCDAVLYMNCYGSVWDLRSPVNMYHFVNISDTVDEWKLIKKKKKSENHWLNVLIIYNGPGLPGLLSINSHGQTPLTSEREILPQTAQQVINILHHMVAITELQEKKMRNKHRIQ